MKEFTLLAEVTKLQNIKVSQRFKAKSKANSLSLAIAQFERELMRQDLIDITKDIVKYSY